MCSVYMLADLPILGWLISAKSTHEFVIVPAEKEVAILKFTVNRNSSLNTQKDRQTDKHAIVLKVINYQSISTPCNV